MLWDLTRGVYLNHEPSGAYSSLVSLLASAGYTVDTTTAGLDNVNLAPYDIIVVNVGSSWDTAYTTSEVAAIEAFVNAGGGLLVMGDNAATPNAHINPVVVSIVSSTVSDPDGIAIPHNTQDATVECVGGFVVVGTVGLQSWPGGPEGISVILRDSSGTTVDQQVVGAAGAFSLTAGDVTQTYSVEASYPRYLSAEATGITGSAGDTVDLGHATLPAGDLNGDGVINILDITIIAGNFNKSSPQSWAP